MFFFFHELLRVIALRPSVCSHNASEPPQGRPRIAPTPAQGEYGRSRVPVSVRGGA